MTAWSRPAELIDRVLFDARPAWHLAALRIAIGVYAIGWLLVVSPQLLGLGDLDRRRFEPVGVIAISGFGPPSKTVAAALVIVTVICGVGFAAGWHYPVAAPAFAAGLVILATYQNSWGKVLHTENLLIVHVVILAASPAAGALSVGHRGRGPTGPSFGWPINVLALATVLSYLAAGVTKVRYAGWDWADPDNLRNWIAYDLVRKELFGDPYLPIATRFLEHPWIFAPAAATTLIVELGAPFALLNKTLARTWAVGAWCLHLGVLAVMSVAFPYQLSTIPVLVVVLASPDSTRATACRRGRWRYGARGDADGRTMVHGERRRATRQLESLHAPPRSRRSPGSP